MLTTRGWWFLVFAGLLTGLGLLGDVPALAPVGLTLLLWLAAVGILFYYRARIVAPRLQVERTLHDDRGPTETLWAGRAVTVVVTVRRPGWVGLPHVVVTDRVPFAVEVESGDEKASGAVGGERALSLRYRVRPAAPGRVRFEGLRLRMADLQGLFYHETFVPAVRLYRTLPVLADTRGRPATTKRTNLLPPPGIHRVRRPGSGSELLDLRDYLPGDPPRTIAWKVSARRDRLITKEFESEVPLRCTLFVDTSNAVRLGPPGRNALARLVAIAAAVAQANAGVRDLTGICLFDEASATVVRPARSGRHLAQVLNLLADASGLAPTTGRAPLTTLLPLAQAFAEEVYPYLLRPELNGVPFLWAWLSPRPAWLRRRPTLRDALFPAFATVGLVLGGLGTLAALGSLGLLLAGFVPPTPLLWLTLIGPPAGAGLLALYVAWQVVFGERRRQEATRKKLAALLSVRHGLGPGGLAALLEDDDLMSEHLQRFLAEHQVPFPLPLHDTEGRYLFASPEKVDVLARALLPAVGKGHDNELFVLLADLFELPDRLGPLLRAVGVALGRHHQVVVVCPWPPGLPPPRGDDAAEREEPAATLADRLREAERRRFERAYREVRQAFARFGVPVVCAADDEPVRLILERMERLRRLGRRR